MNEAKKLHYGDEVLVKARVTNEGGMPMLQVGGVAISLRPELVAADEVAMAKFERWQEGLCCMLLYSRSRDLIRYISEQLKMHAFALEAKNTFLTRPSDYDVMIRDAEACSRLLSMLTPLLREAKEACERDEAIYTNDQEGGEQ